MFSLLFSFSLVCDIIPSTCYLVLGTILYEILIAFSLELFIMMTKRKIFVNIAALNSPTKFTGIEKLMQRLSLRYKTIRDKVATRLDLFHPLVLVPIVHAA